MCFPRIDSFYFLVQKTHQTLSYAKKGRNKFRLSLCKISFLRALKNDAA